MEKEHFLVPSWFWTFELLFKCCMVIVVIRWEGCVLLSLHWAQWSPAVPSSHTYMLHTCSHRTFRTSGEECSCMVRASSSSACVCLTPREQVFLGGDGKNGEFYYACCCIALLVVAVFFFFWKRFRKTIRTLNQCTAWGFSIRFTLDRGALFFFLCIKG